jgi:dsRNA-specific ribonuclease
MKYLLTWKTGTAFHIVKSTVLTNKALHEKGMKLGIDECILMGPAQRDKPATAQMVASTIEALIGAVHIDGGIGAAKAVVCHLGFKVPTK